MKHRKNKIKKGLATLLIFGMIISCKSQNTSEKHKDYELVLDEGIYVEKFDSTNTDENRYTENNSTYKRGKKLTYDYYYQNLKGEKFKFRNRKNVSGLAFKERVKAWDFVSIDSIYNEVIDKVELTVNYGLQSMRSIPGYNQTVITYEYPRLVGESSSMSSTGVIENEKNIWIHPPRNKFFRILELNPFPFIQAPYEIGNQWNWKLKIGDFWADERWKTWEGSIENKYEYQITDRRKISTKIGKFDCFEIKATATSSIGKTHLTAYFNEVVGFVKLEYTNIDSTKTVLEIIKFDESQKK